MLGVPTVPIGKANHVRTTLCVDVGQTGSRLLLTHADGRVERRHGAAGRAGETAEEALVAIVADAVETLGAQSASIDTETGQPTAPRWSSWTGTATPAEGHGCRRCG